MSHFFLFFCREKIRVVSTIFVVMIEDLEVCFANAKLALGKNTIWFEFIGKFYVGPIQIADLRFR